jgi:hypothetical protein
VPPALGAREAIGAILVLEGEAPLHPIGASFLAQLAETVA